MTKPFQSIRQLFGRMIGGNAAGEDGTALKYSTLGIGFPEPQPSPNGAEGQSDGHTGGDLPPDIEAQTADTRKLPQVDPAFLNGRNGGATHHRVAFEEGVDEFGDSLLDLGDVRGAKAFAFDDPILDIGDETAAQAKEEFFVEAIPEARVEVTQPKGEAEESGRTSIARPANLSDLSPEAIDAIAQRVVAQLSDKVVREIAWEVVPELSELLIKQKLEAR